jgi:hypothetical protein
MRLFDWHPHWHTADPAKVIEEMSQENLFLLMAQTSAYYDEKLPMWAVLRYYGVEEVDSQIDKLHVRCVLPTHGGTDTHKSGSYYRFDRDTGEERSAYYCHKCGSRKGPFWFTYAMEQGNNQAKLKDVYFHILRNFRCPPPVNLWGSFDPTDIVIDGGDVKVDHTSGFRAAIALRDLKTTDPTTFLQTLRGMLAGENGRAII